MLRTKLMSFIISTKSKWKNLNDFGSIGSCYYSSLSYERPQESPQKMVSQKGFALFGGQSGSDTKGFRFLITHQIRQTPFERPFFEVTLVVSHKRDYCSGILNVYVNTLWIYFAQVDKGILFSLLLINCVS